MVEIRTGILDVANNIVGIVFSIFGSIGTIIGIVSGGIAIKLYIQDKKNKQLKFGKMLENRKSFIETSIIKINKEFEPVTIKTKHYDFKVNGYTISLKTGESLIIPHPVPEEFDNLLIFGWGCAWKEIYFIWDEISQNDSNEFKEFLKRNIGVNWINVANIRKIDDSSIKIYTENNSLLLKLNDEKTKVILIIDNANTYEFNVKTNDGKLAIYYKIPLGDIKSNEKLGEFSFINSELNQIQKVDIVQPGKDCERNRLCGECKNPGCIKLLDANPDPIYGGDPSVDEMRKRGILGKIKSYYENIHTHWIDLNIYVCALKIPSEAKYIKISLEKQNQIITDVSLNIAEIIPATKEECSEIIEILKKGIQSPKIDNKDVKNIINIYQRLRNERELAATDDLWISVDEYIEKDIYVASKLLKYALMLENSLKEEKKEIFEKVMIKLSEKAMNEEDVQSCCLLSHLYGFNAKFDPKHKEEYQKKAMEHIVRAGDMIDEIIKIDNTKCDELLNLQWRCYESAAREYDKLSDFQKEFDIRIKLNHVFKRITKKHPFASPIMDNAFENFKNTTNVCKKYRNTSIK